MFSVSLLKQKTTRKGRINEFAEVLKFEPGDNKEDKIKTIQDTTVSAKETDGHLTKLYNLIA